MTITICMGSSCYSRGNGRNIAAIQEFLSQRRLEGQVGLIGHLCKDQCRCGPNIEVGGKLYQQVDAVAIVSIVQEAVGERA